MMAHPLREMPFEPLGNLILDFPAVASVSNYRRELDLDTAIASVTYNTPTAEYRREVFASPADQVIVIHLTANKPGEVAFRVAVQTLRQQPSAPNLRQRCCSPARTARPRESRAHSSSRPA